MTKGMLVSVCVCVCAWVGGVEGGILPAPFQLCKWPATNKDKSLRFR